MTTLAPSKRQSIVNTQRNPRYYVDHRSIATKVGSRLRNCRENAGLSRSEVGRLMGVSFQQVQKYETGLNQLSVSRLLQFCGALGTSPHNVLDEL